MIIPLMRLLQSGECDNRTASLAHHVQQPAAAVLETLQQLRDVFGAVCESNQQWQLTFSPQWLDAPTLTQQLQKLESESVFNSLHDISQNGLESVGVHITDEIRGSNDWAKTSDAKAAINFFYCEHQTQGRGRHHRQWLAMPGGSVMMSMRVPAPSLLSGLSLAIGAGLWRVFVEKINEEKTESCSAENAQGQNTPLFLKWPNDLLDAAGNKIGGILIEKFGEHLIIGVGINLIMNQTLQQHLQRPAAALRFDGERNACAALVAHTLQHTLHTYTKNGLRPFMDDIKRAHYVQPKQHIRFTTAHGEQLRGQFAGFDADGALLVQQEQTAHIKQSGEVQRFISGEISHVVSR